MSVLSRCRRLPLSIALIVTVLLLFGARAQAFQDVSPDEQSLDNLKSLAVATLMFAQDHGDQFPAMDSPESYQKSVAAYVRHKDKFIQPSSHKPYQPNSFLVGKRMGQVEAPAATVELYEPVPARDGAVAVAFCDGHCKRLSAEEWRRARIASHIPLK